MLCYSVINSPFLPLSDFYTFLRSLELTIQKVQLRNERLILCGDWNVNFMQQSLRLHHLEKLLLLYNLINTVRSRTRVTKNNVSLIDVIITNKDNHEKVAIIVDLGYSDHKALILHLNVNTVIRKHKRVKLRHFTVRSILLHFCFFNKVCLRAHELLAHEPRVPWWSCHLEAQALAFTLMFVFIRAFPLFF
jgi:hypothetical protein